MNSILGQLAYEAYCEQRNWRSVGGEALPLWHDQSAELKEAWEAAAEAVKNKVLARDWS